MTVLEEGIEKMPSGNQPGDRWALLKKTSPSGKAMFRCLSCGQEDVVPRKLCWTSRVGAVEWTEREPNVACMTWQKHPLHTYKLESVKGSGWAWIVLSSTGYFSAVSDFGNFAFFWTHHGCADFRQFIYNAHKSWDYFCSKLSYGPGDKTKEYDGPSTYAAIKEHILQYRRDGSWDSARAREEWDLLHGDAERVETEGSWDHWMRNSRIDDAWEYYHERWPGGLERFCKETLKRLTEEHLHKELEREGLLNGACR